MSRILLVFLVFFSARAWSSDRVFTVPEVPVFAQAKSSAQARAEARDQGRAVAFDLLMRRLVAEEDWIYLPQMSQNLPAAASPEMFGEGLDIDLSSEMAPRMKTPVTVDANGLRSLEQETNVFDEKSSGTTYRASITYRFKPDAIRALLQGARLPYSEEQAREAMILPVLKTANGVYLWEAKNPWARAWLDRPLSHELTPFVMPRGDIVDIEAITAEEALNLDTARLRAFAERYNLSRLMLAVGELREQGPDFQFTVTLIEATPPVEVGEISAIGARVGEAYFRGGVNDFPLLARQAVEGTVENHARRWKRQTLVDFGLRRTLRLTAWFESQRGWSDIQDAIQSSALVVEREDGVFNRKNAIVDLTVVGEANQFRLAMAQHALDVWQDSTGRWHIAEKDLAAELKKELRPLTTDLDEQVEERRGLGRIFGRRNNRSRDTEDDVPDLPEDLFGDDPN
ncbi:MAG: DUF2066 domain-containing protein [Parvularculaceae bacterium]|nr:DUF2066 domain-containing protein [Parvularculaceae bacterium]